MGRGNDPGQTRTTKVWQSMAPKRPPTTTLVVRAATRNRQSRTNLSPLLQLEFTLSVQIPLPGTGTILSSY
jgi:hypothetical protein